MNLIRIGIEDARKLWQMQTEAFQDLYKKYQDTENSPAAENIDKTIMRLQQPSPITILFRNSMKTSAQYGSLTKEKKTQLKEYLLFLCFLNINDSALHKKPSVWLKLCMAVQIGN